MIYHESPENFNPRFDIVSCFCEHKGELLLLHRQDNKSEGDKWGVPAGKIDPGEVPLQAMQRELKEETGLSIQPERLTYLNKVFVRYPDYDFVYYMYLIQLESRRRVKIAPKEHKDYIWTSPTHALGMKLVQDLGATIRLQYSNLPQP